MKLTSLLKTCVSCCLLLLTFIANANYRFDNVYLSHQLDEQITSAIIKDHQGFVWIGTSNGLYRFDGHKSFIYRHIPENSTSLSNNFITAIYQHNDNYIWVGTKNGLNLFDINNETFYHFYHQSDIETSISHNYITAIEGADQGRIWVATGGGGLNLYSPIDTENPAKGEFAHNKHNPNDNSSISNNFITSLLKSSSGILWIGTGKGLDGITLGPAIRISTQTQAKLSADDVSTIFEDNTGAIWVGTSSGTLDKLQLDLNQQDGIEIQPVKLSDSLRTYSVESIIQDKRGQLWIGTFGGGVAIVNINHNKVKFIQQTASNHLNTVSCLLLDDQGIIWLGSDKGIVSKYDTQKERFGHLAIPLASSTIRHSRKVSSNITAISSDHHGQLWIGTENHGIAILNSNGEIGLQINQQSLNGPLLDDNIKFLFRDKSNNMWVGSHQGIQKFNSRGKLSKIEFLPQISESGEYQNFIKFNTMAQDKQGNLWFGSNFGVYVYQVEQQTLVHFRNHIGDIRSLSHNNVNTIYTGSHGSIWIGTSKGLNRYLPNTRVFERFNQLSHNFINSISQTHEDTLWIGTDGGLNLLVTDSGDVSYFTTQNGLADDTINGLLNDEQDNLWLSTNKGIIRVTPDYRTPVNQLKLLSVVNFTPDDGLQGKDYNPGAFYKSQQGELLFGGDNGINKFYASNIALRQPPTKILITDLLLLNQSVKQLAQQNKLIDLEYDSAIHLLSHFELNYHYNLFAFEFSALNHAYPNKVRYRYRLNGFDNNWIETDASIRRATYTNLSAGDYVLQLNASDTKGNWSTDISEVSLTVSPAPWLSTWAYLVYALIVFIILLTLYYLRLEHNKVLYTQRLNRTLERKVVERTVQLQQQKEEVEILIAERTEQLERSNQSIASMSEICSQISSTLGFEALLVTAYTHIKELMDADIFLIGLFEKKQQMVEFQLIVDKKQYTDELRLSVDESNRPAIWCYKHQKPLIINNMNQEYSDYFEQLPEPPPTASKPIKSILYWPLMVGGQIIGVLSVQSYREHAYHTYQQHTIQTLASTTAIALDHARAYREVERQKNAVEQKVEQRTKQLQHRTKQLQQINLNITAVRHICNQISSNLNMKELPYQVYIRIRELMDTDVFMIGLYDKDQQTITFEVALKNNQQISTTAESMEELDRPAVWCIKHQMPMIVNDLQQDLKHYFGDTPVIQRIPGQVVESFVYWPLIVGKKIIGVITVQSHVKAAYNEHHQDMIATIAATTAVALDNASAYREVEYKNQEILLTQNNLVQSEKLASLGTLTAGVAHEINNPTNFVHVSAENLEVDLDSFHQFIIKLAGDNAEQEILDSLHRRLEPLHKHILTIKDGTQRIKTIVKDLRSFTHIDVKEKEEINVANILTSTINLAKSRYKEVASVHAKYDAEIMLSCHPAQLSQVFMNLIVNACDAIKTRLEQQNRDKQQLDPNQRGNITVDCIKTAEYVEITVADDGCGMDEQTKIKLFEPFYTTKKVGEGTGLGLSISYGIIEKHQGKLLVDSTEGEGSIFRVIIPL